MGGVEGMRWADVEWEKKTRYDDLIGNNVVGRCGWWKSVGGREDLGKYHVSIRQERARESDTIGRGEGKRGEAINTKTCENSIITSRHI